MWKKKISRLPALVFLAGWGCLLLDAIRIDAVNAILLQFSTGIQTLVTVFFLGYLVWLLRRCVFTGLEKAFLCFWSLPLFLRALMMVIGFFAAPGGESGCLRIFPPIASSLLSLAGDCLIWGVIGLLARPKAAPIGNPSAGGDEHDTFSVPLR